MLESAQTHRLREASGNVTSDDRFVSFLYEVMRDHIPVGVMERHVLDSLKRETGITGLVEALAMITGDRDMIEEIQRRTKYDESMPVTYTNGWLARYAMDIAMRMWGIPEEVANDFVKATVK